MTHKDKIILDKLPEHIAVIMDGNGRWAKKKGNSRIFGHTNGVTAVRETVEAAAELGVKFLTLYAFSTENWNRPKMEVDALMSLLVSSLHDETPTLLKNNISLAAIGDISRLTDKVAGRLTAAIEKTSHNTGLKLILALNYSGRWEILDAVNRIKADIAAGKLNTGITAELFSYYLNTKNMPDPELLIRTSGEYRISNFLLWQIAYTELYFTPTLWPDFRKEDFYKAIVDFQKRERRFGKTSEQLNQYEQTVNK
ncbi:MAG: isoprenyl transferase [Bacteroidales bacterium]|jgi:undecaprenyl diphosphate synthase|nr:isoprenyl transferase [Bacteroidales bacterium]